MAHPLSPPGRLLLAYPFISFSSCWTQQEQLGTLPPPLLNTHTSPNSIFPLITLLYENQMLPNGSLNCKSGTLEDIKGPF